MTEQELRTLARDWSEGRIVFSTQVPKHLISIVFMPVTFLDEEQRKQLITENVFAFYGNMADAGPQAINGYPIFMKMSKISKPDYDKVREYVKAYEEMQKQFETGATA